MQTTTPFLWFNNQAQEAALFYVSVFKNSKLLGSSPSDARVEINGQRLYLFNGGPTYRFNPAISLMVECDDQAEVDHLWTSLCEGGAPNQCGWLTDKYGLSWQIIPKLLAQLLGDADREKANRAMRAMLKMTKIESAELLQAISD
jgi:predicted 3-demethylubiquinone-9 3-methyltransferase (glyoxalase superfamily)